jgi:hypothetical protein
VERAVGAQACGEGVAGRDRGASGGGEADRLGQRGEGAGEGGVRELLRDGGAQAWRPARPDQERGRQRTEARLGHATQHDEAVGVRGHQGDRRRRVRGRPGEVFLVDHDRQPGAEGALHEAQGVQRQAERARAAENADLGGLIGEHAVERAGLKRPLEVAADVHPARAGQEDGALERGVDRARERDDVLGAEQAGQEHREASVATGRDDRRGGIEPEGGRPDRGQRVGAACAKGVGPAHGVGHRGRRGQADRGQRWRRAEVTVLRVAQLHTAMVAQAAAAAHARRGARSTSEYSKAFSNRRTPSLPWPAAGPTVTAYC